MLLHYKSHVTDVPQLSAISYLKFRISIIQQSRGSLRPRSPNIPHFEDTDSS